MKRKIILVLSVILFCPMWVAAQINTPTFNSYGVPTIAGPIFWNFQDTSPLNFQGFINTTQVIIPNNGATPSPINAVKSMTVNFTDPQNSEGFFSIAGAALVSYISSTQSWADYTVSIPVTGAMIPISGNTYTNGSNPTGYAATFYVGSGSFTCNLSIILNGKCIGNNGLSLNIVAEPN